MQNGQMRIQRVILKHESDTAMLGRRFGHVVLSEKDLSARRLLQTADERKRRAFATARRSEKTDQLAIGNLEGEIVHRNDVFPFLSARGKFFGYVLKYYFHMRFPFIKATCIFMVLL